MIKYKIDVFEELKKHGYNQTRIQKERLLPAQTAQNIKAGKSITLETLNKICIMCKLQPGDIVEVVPTNEEIIKYYWKNVDNILILEYNIISPRDKGLITKKVEGKRNLKGKGVKHGRYDRERTSNITDRWIYKVAEN